MAGLVRLAPNQMTRTYDVRWEGGQQVGGWWC